MAKKRLTGIGFGTPIVSASLSWERVGAGNDLGAGNGCLVLQGGKLPTVRQAADPIMMGVHPSSVIPGGSRGAKGEPLMERVPAYVARDVDEGLQRRLAGSGFVVLVGDSSAGKSRAAFEAVAAVLPDHVLVAPQNRSAVANAVSAAESTRRCVLWLDDLENYIGAGGLTRAGIARVMAGRRVHRVIVATLRATEEILLTSDAAGEEGGWQSRRDAREVLELAHRISVARLFSKPELKRARAHAWDPRIAEALTHADLYGVAEYMAAGPELMRDWEDAWSPNTDPRVPSHPRGAALIAAAVDLRRGGFGSPLPCTVLEEVHEHYLRERGGARLRPESLRDAWTWATRARRATTALLQHVDDEHVQVFDYLFDVVQRGSRAGHHVSDSILEAALAACAPIDADNIARTAARNGRYQLAEKASDRAYRARENALGAEHHDTLAARAFHADILRELGHDAEFEHEHGVVSEIAARAFGPEDPLVLESRNSRAYALIRLGRPAEAEKELRAVRDVSSRVLGLGHDVTITSRHFRAIALSNLDKLAEAEAENRFVLDTWTREFGHEHMSTLYSRGNLAITLYRAGRFEEAESEASIVLDIRIRTFGQEHPLTLYTRSLRAAVLHELGRPAEAENEYQVIADISARAFGAEAHLALESRTRHASALTRLGRFEEAESEASIVLDICTRAFGQEHPLTLYTRSLRAAVLRELGRPAEAENEYQVIADISARAFGAEAQRVLDSRSGRGFALIHLGRFAEAEEELQAVHDVSSRVLGPGHDTTMTSRHLRAIALLGLGRLAEAEAENRFILNAWTRQFGPENISTLYSRGNLARVLLKSGRLEEAEAEAHAVLEIRTRILGPEHPDTLRITSLILQIEDARNHTVS
jgi:tetratricopeptide (TPR) repeat protein